MTDPPRAAALLADVGVPAHLEPRPHPASEMACLYCRRPIAAGAFAYWSQSRRILSATCPSCHRRVTLTAATWRSWSNGVDAPAATSAAIEFPIQGDGT
jgi:hypothetical protein